MEHALRRSGPGLLAFAIVLSACRGRDAAVPDPDERLPSPPPAAVSVGVSAATRGTVTEVVTGPGRTSALAQQKVRAPFTGTLTELVVTEGDRVTRGQRLGTIVSRDSEAALTGAREMAREAKTEAEKRDAARAVSLAERSLVQAPLSSPADGVVLSRAGAAGERVSEDQEILAIAETSSIVFLVDVAQSDLGRIHPGQRVDVDLAGRSGTVAGSVHDVLPGANAADFTVPVRVDLRGLGKAPPLGLYGRAKITVGQRRGVLLVPEEAVIRDDVHGTTRIALVRNDRAHWVDVTLGGHAPGRVEIVLPALSPGDTVIVSGQVGLPDNSRIAVTP
jgi:multidrug efflux pump subunit AcrA (membrane-fusion protein)